MSSTQKMLDSTTAIVAKLVDELKARHRLSLADFKSAVESLTSIRSPDTNRYKFLLADLGQKVHFRADLELVEVTDIILTRGGDPDGLVTLTEMAMSKLLLSSLTDEDADNQMTGQSINDPYELGCSDVAYLLLLDAGIITKSELKWWFGLLHKICQLPVGVVESEDEPAVSAQLDGLAPDLNQLRHIIKSSYVPFGLECSPELELLSSAASRLLDDRVVGTKYAPLAY